MSKDHLEKRTYRKSPGRQYGYEYDPLRSRTGSSQSGSWSSNGEAVSKSGALLAQRPDPRRTRQLLRQSIIASKAHSSDEEAEVVEYNIPEDQSLYDDLDEDTTQTVQTKRSLSQSGRLARPYPYSSRRSIELEDDNYAPWRNLEEVDPDQDYDDPFDVRPGYVPPKTGATLSPSLRTRHEVPQVFEEENEDFEYEYEDENDRPSVRRSPKKRKVSRRGLLFGAGAVAVVGVGIAAAELAPKLPQAIGDAGANIEHQMQDAFNRGINQGAETARKELVTALDNLEGFSLEGAITAARLTRVAYDVFVSPVVKFGATVTGDFLNGMLQAYKTGRGWLKNIGQDNATLAAIQDVLDTWVNQVTNMPKQLDSVTQTDLDGAQAYLRALQRKIEEEKAKLNNPSTPVAKPAPKTTPSPKSSAK